MEKSYVTMEKKVCISCWTEQDTGALLLDERLRERFDRYTTTGYFLCNECKELASKAGAVIALIIKEGMEEKLQGDFVSLEHALPYIEDTKVMDNEELLKAAQGSPVIYLSSELIMDLEELRKRVEFPKITSEDPRTIQAQKDLIEISEKILFFGWRVFLDFEKCKGFFTDKEGLEVVSFFTKDTMVPKFFKETVPSLTYGNGYTLPFEYSYQWMLISPPPKTAEEAESITLPAFLNRNASNGYKELEIKKESIS